GVNLGAFAVGSHPVGVTFDGRNIWVVNNGDGNVTKLLPSDGTNLGTFATMSTPQGVAFDGANIWVLDRAKVMKLRVSDGANLGIFSTNSINGSQCYSSRRVNGIAFDGTNMWVACRASNSVTKLRAGDGSPLGGYVVGSEPPLHPPTGGGLSIADTLMGVAFDGTNIWVANKPGGTVTKFRASDGAVLGTVVVGTRSGVLVSNAVKPCGVAFDGTNIWVTAAGFNIVSKR
ncbi:MAG: hypothetical protein ACJ741_20185, partial [Pyrinomonadaceae bacterium]